MSPTTGVAHTNETITIDIYAESITEQVNAVSGTIVFPSNLLAAQSISKKDSALDWWTVEPSLSNTEGMLRFEGVALKGFSGQKVKILSIVFKVLAAGKASLSFSAASLLANDGSGNNIFSGSTGTQYSLREGRPLAASVASNDIPSPATTTPVHATPPLPQSSLTIPLHIRELRRDDLTHPVASFSVTLPEEIRTAYPYAIYINGEAIGMWRDDGSHIYRTPITEGGTHAIIMKTISTDGNTIIGSAPFEITPLLTPSIETYDLKRGVSMPLVTGRSAYPRATIRAFFKDTNAVIRLQETRADDQGNFIIDPNTTIPRSSYTVWVEAVDGRGGKSAKSNAVMVAAPFARLPLIYFIIGASIILYIALRHGKHPAEFTQLNNQSDFR